MDTSQRSELTQAVERSSGSYELVLSAVLVSLIGFGIDRWLGLLPLFTIVFAFVGFVGAGASLYYRYTEEMARENLARAEAADLPRTGGADS